MALLPPKKSVTTSNPNADAVISKVFWMSLSALPIAAAVAHHSLAPFTNPVLIPDVPLLWHGICIVFAVVAFKSC